MNKKYDVMIIGGGTAGIPAAIAAARNGAKTILIEKNDYLGGCIIGGATGLYSYFNVFHPYPNARKERIVDGIPHELFLEMKKLNAGIGHIEIKDNKHAYSVITTIDPEIFKYLAHKILDNEGVDILLQSFAVEAIKENEKIKGAVIENKQGRKTFLASQVIDCTGDGDIAAKAGCNFKQYKKEDGIGVSLIFRMGSVDLDKIYKDFVLPDKKGLIQVARAEKPNTSDEEIIKLGFVLKKLFPEKIKEIGIPGHFFLTSLYESDLTFCNCTFHIPDDNLNVKSLTNSNLLLREQIIKFVDFLKEEIPGFKNSYITSTSPNLGVRKTRIFDCLYELKEEEIIKGRSFYDQIGKMSFVDLPNKFVEDGGWVGLPFRAMIPEKIDNILLAGRMISHDKVAHETTRNTVPCMIQGQAAGTAAAICAQKNISPKAIDIKELKSTLRNADVLLD